jgi:hypothetical protein
MAYGKKDTGLTGSPFVDCVVPVPNGKSDWEGATYGGESKLQGTEKGDDGRVPELTNIIIGGVKEGDKATVGKEIATGKGRRGDAPV